MAKKEFTYRGKSLNELMMLSVKQFSELLPARQRRSIERGFTDEQKKVLTKVEKDDKNIRTHCRDLIIFPMMVGKEIKVYNGKTFETLRIQEEMIGHVLGEFVLTRRRVGHNAPGVGATRSSASISVR